MIVPEQQACQVRGDQCEAAGQAVHVRSGRSNRLRLRLAVSSRGTRRAPVHARHVRWGHGCSEAQGREAVVKSRL